MGMLMHRTWLEQQEKLKKAANAAEEPVKEETVAEETAKEETKPKAPAKAGSRRKAK